MTTTEWTPGAVLDVIGDAVPDRLMTVWQNAKARSSSPGVADALVVGRPSPRWGEEVVALVSVHPGADVTSALLHSSCTSQLARFKAPKAFHFVDEIRRLGNGKPDYRWAKSQAALYAVAGSPSS